MNSEAYRALAPFYDSLMEDADYPGFITFYESCIKRYAEIPVGSVLDAGCGTGVISCMLAAHGYDVTGIDASEEMLSLAAKRAEHERQNVLLLHQNMATMELYGTVDAIVSSLDCVNYITDLSSLSRFFNHAFLYLSPGGLLIFDVNTVYKFETVFADRCYCLEDGQVFCAWQNAYTPSTRLCRFFLTLFRKDADGRYHRYEEEQRERAYSDRTLLRLLKSAGFSVCGLFADFAFQPAAEQDERHFFVLKKPLDSAQ